MLPRVKKKEGKKRLNQDFIVFAEDVCQAFKQFLFEGNLGGLLFGEGFFELFRLARAQVAERAVFCHVGLFELFVLAVKVAHDEGGVAEDSEFGEFLPVFEAQFGLLEFLDAFALDVVNEESDELVAFFAYVLDFGFVEFAFVVVRFCFHEVVQRAEEFGGHFARGDELFFEHVREFFFGGALDAFHF